MKKDIISAQMASLQPQLQRICASDVLASLVRLPTEQFMHKHDNSRNQDPTQQSTQKAKAKCSSVAELTIGEKTWPQQSAGYHEWHRQHFSPSRPTAPCLRRFLIRWQAIAAAQIRIDLRLYITRFPRSSHLSISDRGPMRAMRWSCSCSIYQTRRPRH